MSLAPVAPAYAPPSLHRASKVFVRNLLAYKYHWIAFVTGFFEPLFYLLGVGFGVGRFVGEVSFGGATISYPAFLAPGLLAASTMNAAIFDGFFGPFFKLTWMKTYDGILTTPLSVPDIALGEVLWALSRGTIYGSGFLIVMWSLGLVDSLWGLLALPAVMLSSGALSASAMMLTGIAKQISSLEKVMTLIVFPLFLFSGTFFPVSLYPVYLQPVVYATPLYHSATLLRSLTTGQVGPGTLWHVVYLVVLLVVAGVIATRLIRRRLVS